MLSRDQLEELTTVFKTIDRDGSGFISISELGDALSVVGIKLPAYEIRQIIQQFDNKINDGQLDFEEFKMMYATLKNERDIGHKFKKLVVAREGLDNYGGMSATSTEGTTHTVRKEEEVAFANWINKNLAADPDCQKYLPLNPENKNLYMNSGDGVLICKMINCSAPDTIDERTINKGAKLSLFQKNENLDLAINSAGSIGCSVVNIGPEDLHAGKPHLVLGLLWQIIRIGLFQDINIHQHPGLAILLQEGETLEDLMKLSPEEILIRWVNYHLSRSTCGRRVNNFTSDITDSIAYIHLLHQISPKEAGVTTAPEQEGDPRQRAELMLQESDKIGCRSFLSPDDVVSGNYKLNLAFVANLFNNCPALDDREGEGLGELDFDNIQEETREEKTYRNWMNSMGVQPHVYHIYGDLTDALIIFQLYDIIKPGMVDWSRVIKNFNKLRVMMEKIANCNYAVELGKKSKFSLVGIDGKDLYDANPTLTLALVWQLMRAYTLTILTKLAGSDAHVVAEKEIVEWANSKLEGAQKQNRISGFNDPSIATSMAVIDLVDAIKPNSVNYSLLKEGLTNADKLENAKYAISMARKIGAKVYALPEDIVEVKAKMVMTIFACLMIKDFQPKQK